MGVWLKRYASKTCIHTFPARSKAMKTKKAMKDMTAKPPKARKAMKVMKDTNATRSKQHRKTHRADIRVKQLDTYNVHL